MKNNESSLKELREIQKKIKEDADQQIERFEEKLQENVSAY